MRTHFKIPTKVLETKRSEVLLDINRTSQLLDVTIVNEKQEFYAHKLMLATVSPIFRKILVRAGDKHALLYLKGTKSENIEAMLNFIYSGEARIPTRLLDDFIAFGNEMKIFGMSEGQALSAKPVPFKPIDKNFADTANKIKNFPEIRALVEIDNEEVTCQNNVVSSKALFHNQFPFQTNAENCALTANTVTNCPETVEIDNEGTSDNTQKIEVSHGNFQCKDCPKVFKDMLTYRNHLPCINITADNILNDEIDAERDNTSNNYIVANNSTSQHSETFLRPPLSVFNSVPPENVEVTPDITSLRPPVSVSKMEKPKRVESTAEYVEYDEENQKPDIKPLPLTPVPVISSPNNSDITSSEEFNAMIVQLLIKNETSWSCSVCPYSSHTMGHLVDHAEKHITGKLYQCQVCKKTFKKHFVMRRHLYKEHPQFKGSVTIKMRDLERIV